MLRHWVLREAKTGRSRLEIGMARKGKTGVLKRLREVKKAEKAALKRDQRDQRRQEPGESTRVATKDDLEGYGFPSDGGDEEENADLPAPGLRERSPTGNGSAWDV